MASEFAIAACLTCLVATNVSGSVTPTISFETFDSLVGLSLVGDASQFENHLRLTPAERAKVGGAWFAEKQDVSKGFITSFEFEVSDPDPNFGADGFAFIVQNDSSAALGVGGSSLGFMDVGDGPGLDNYLAIEFDTLNSGITFDSNGNHIAVQSRPKNPPQSRVFLGTSNPPFTIQSGGIHSAQIKYLPDLLQIYVDGDSSPLLQVDVDLDQLLDPIEGKAWVGFTGATGAAWENHDILSWTFASIPEPTTIALLVPVFVAMFHRTF